jgi:hypothetical protein
MGGLNERHYLCSIPFYVISGKYTGPLKPFIFDQNE